MVKGMTMTEGDVIRIVREEIDGGRSNDMEFLVDLYCELLDDRYVHLMNEK